MACRLSLILVMKFLMSAGLGAALISAWTYATTAAADEIAIAVAAPMTGQFAAFGAQLREGATLAVKDINAAGGVRGKTLKLIIADDQCDPKQAVQVANDLVAKGVVFVDGHFCSSASIPASRIYADNGILQITPASTSPLLTDEAAAKGINTILRTVAREDWSGTVAGSWMANTYKGKKVAVLNNNTPYGTDLADEAQSAMEAAGVKPSILGSYKSSADLAALISKLKESKMDAVFVGGYADDVADLSRQMRAENLQVDLISGDDLQSPEFWKQAGTAGNGVQYVGETSPLSLDSAKPAIEALRKAGTEPDADALRSYAAVQVFAAAANAKDSTDGPKLGEWLRKNTVRTILGDLTWNLAGDISKPDYSVYAWQDGTSIERASLRCPPYCPKN